MLVNKYKATFKVAFLLIKKGKIIMRKKTVDAQLNNFKCQQFYMRRCLTLAENVFDIKNLPTYIDKAYLNKTLVRKGAIAFFRDEVLGLLALPYSNLGNLDVYNRPIDIQVIGKNGYTKKLSNRNGKKEFVIMYDNEGRYSLVIDIIQFANRLSLYERTADINISQQKTPRFVKCNSDSELAVKDALSQIDSFEENILAYKNLETEDFEWVLAPAPFVADKVHQEKRNLWNEFLSLIGIANLGVEKKERQIVDEIQQMQGGTIASRFSRFTSRKDAIDEINKYLIEPYDEKKLEVEYYDGLPTTLKESEVTNESSNEEKNIIEMESGV